MASDEPAPRHINTANQSENGEDELEDEDEEDDDDVELDEDQLVGNSVCRLVLVKHGGQS